MASHGPPRAAKWTQHDLRTTPAYEQASTYTKPHAATDRGITRRIETHLPYMKWLRGDVHSELHLLRNHANHNHSKLDDPLKPQLEKASRYQAKPTLFCEYGLSSPSANLGFTVLWKCFVCLGAELREFWVATLASSIVIHNTW